MKGFMQRTLLWRILVVVMLVAGCSGRPAPTPTPPSLSPATAVRIVVEADGIYQVTAAELATVGFDLAAFQPEGLALSTGGQAVAFQLVGAGRERALRFYGQARPADALSAQNVYWLSAAGLAAGQVAQPMRSISARPEGELTTVVSATVRSEEQRLFVHNVGAGDDRWFWASLFAPTEFKVPLQVTRLASGEAELRVRTWGNSSAPVNPDHHLLLTLNGTAVADVSWDGQGAYTITATLPAGLLQPGVNQLVLRSPGDTGATADTVLLDWVELTYPRSLIADDGWLGFTGTASGYIVELGDEVAALWDVTDPMQPIALSGFTAERGTVRFSAAGVLQHLALASSQALRRPAALSAVSGGLPWHGEPLLAPADGADVIVVTVPQLRPALAPWIAARQAAGLRVAVVDVGEVYDAFSFGRADPLALRAFIRHAVATWPRPAPRFVLLAGDASYDPRGYLKGPEANLVPTALVNTFFSGWTASDVWFALPDDGEDARPLLAIGRFPAQNAEQLTAMIAKTLDYERTDALASWRGRALIVADNDDSSFALEAQAFADALSGYAVQTLTIAGDGAEVRTALLRAFTEGVGLVGYMGHGSLSLWAQEKVLSVEDVMKLTNRPRLPIALTLTCLSGLFQHPTTVSLGEALLRSRDGGAVAALMPSSAATLDQQRQLSEQFARALTVSAPDGLTLGEVVHRAQLGLPRFTEGLGGVREIMLTYNLLGDPTLRVR